MMEDNRLPKNCKQGRIIYELDFNHLKIREVASAAHDVAARGVPAIGMFPIISFRQFDMVQTISTQT